MNALTRAFADSQRSLIAAKASVTQATNELMARGPSGLPFYQPDLINAAEQVRHFRGWVYAAIRPIAQRIAGQPIKVGRRRGLSQFGTKDAGDVQPLDNHEILSLLADPNDLMVSWSLIFSMVANLELTGRQLWWLPKRKQILPIPTSWIRGFEGATRITSFKVQPPHVGEVFDLPAEECVYFSYPHPGDPHGVCPPLQSVAGAVSSDEAIVESQNAMFRRGIHPSHVVLVGKDEQSKLRPRLTAAQQRTIISAIRKRYADTHNHGEPLILDGLIEDVRRLSNTPAEMDWLDSGKSTKARIAQGFGTNPIIMGEIEGANRASAQVADEHFCQYTLNPKIELISQCLTEWLRPMFDNDLVVWIEPCHARDSDMQFKWAQMLAKHSAITGDELRELSPFDLELGQFTEPVAGAGRNPEEEELNEMVRDAFEEIKGFDVDGEVRKAWLNADGRANRVLESVS